jgi:hypothetical protein
VSTITYSGRLTVTTCWCGMVHAVPQELRDHQQRAHDSGGKVPNIYCPLGHAHVPSGKPRWEAERDARLRIEKRLDATRDLLEHEERSHAATRGHLTRAKKRATAGVCPCCNRSFANVRRHVESQHPDELPDVERELP